MPIIFTMFPASGYFVAKFSGTITDNDMLSAYERLFKHPDWDPGLRALTDLSEVDAGEVSKYGVEKLAKLNKRIFSHHEAMPRSAIYAPADLSFRLARMYESEVFGFERSAVFRCRQAAYDWLMEP